MGADTLRRRFNKINELRLVFKILQIQYNYMILKDIYLNPHATCRLKVSAPKANCYHLTTKPKDSFNIMSSIKEIKMISKF